MEVRVADLRYIDTIFNGGSCCKPQVQILFLLEVVYTGESSLNLFYLIKYAGLQQGNNDVNVNSTIKSPLTLHKKKRLDWWRPHSAHPDIRPSVQVQEQELIDRRSRSSTRSCRRACRTAWPFPQPTCIGRLLAQQSYCSCCSNHERRGNRSY